MRTRPFRPLRHASAQQFVRLLLIQRLLGARPVLRPVSLFRHTCSAHKTMADSVFRRKTQSHPRKTPFSKYETTSTTTIDYIKECERATASSTDPSIGP